MPLVSILAVLCQNALIAESSHWKGLLYYGNIDAPGDKKAAIETEITSVGYELILHPDGGYEMIHGSRRLTGTYKRKDRTIIFTPIKVDGSSAASFLKDQISRSEDHARPAQAITIPVSAVINTNGKSIELRYDLTGEIIVFRRTGTVKSTVSRTEKSYVGEWNYASGGSDTVDPAEAYSRPRIRLVLAADNTFFRTHTGNAFGTWRLQNGKIVLKDKHPNPAFPAPTVTAQKNGTLKLEFPEISDMFFVKKRK